MAIIQNNSSINMLSLLTGTMCLLICYVWLQEKWLRTSGDEDASIATTDSADSSTDQDTQVEGFLLFSLTEDIQQHELITAAYAQVGQNFDIRDHLLGDNYGKLQRLEMISHRWLLARLSIPLRKIVDRHKGFGETTTGSCFLLLVPQDSVRTGTQLRKSMFLCFFLLHAAKVPFF